MASRKLLLRAARLLQGEAELQRESCQIQRPGAAKPTDWACADCKGSTTCAARRHYVRLSRAAQELRDAA